MILWRTIDPDRLYQPFRHRLELLLGMLPDIWVITYGFRTFAEQDTLWHAHLVGGPRAAPPGHSPHEVGGAIDLVLDGDPGRVGVQPDYEINHPAWQRLFAEIKADPFLHSGLSFGDPDHIEWIGWQNLSH